MSHCLQFTKVPGNLLIQSGAETSSEEMFIIRIRGLINVGSWLWNYWKELTEILCQSQHKLAQTSGGCLRQHFTRKTHLSQPEWECAVSVCCILWGFPHCIVVMFCYDVEHWPLRQYFIFILDNLPCHCQSCDCDCWCFTRIGSSPFMSICRVNEQVVPIIDPREEGEGLWSSQIQLYYWWACCNNLQNLKAGTLN